MDSSNLLIVAMIEQCRGMILDSEHDDEQLPESVRSTHLLQMCNRIETNAENWPATKLHRWIGFIQCGMLANRILDIDAAKAMFDKAKNAYGTDKVDQDLIDHLDPNSSFRLDVGGEG